MNFNKHYELKDKHAFLSPSNHSWINYNEDKVQQRYLAFQAVERGNKLHKLAKDCIDLGEPLKGNKSSLSMFVRDAIGFKMTTEQALFYSPNCFGHCDAISFRDNELRIHDLKTGVIQASMDQLLIYAALFCLEYQIDPEDIFIELRIYQFGDIDICNPSTEVIRELMQKIIDFDKIINELKE